MPDWIIRTATREDRPKLAGIMRAALDGLGFVPSLHTPGEDAAFMAGLLLSAEAWVAAVDDQPVGFIAVTKGTDVLALYVAAEWQAKGIGPALLAAAKQDRHELSLHCFQQNHIARSFYEAHGFDIIAQDDVGRNDEGLPDVTYRWQAPIADDVDWSKGAAWQDGQIIPIADAKIGVTDWGLTHSDITYDVASVWEGGFFRLNDYIERFLASMQALRLEVDQDAASIRQICHDMVAQAGLRSAYVAMVASRGQPLIPGNRDPRQCNNHFFAWAVPYVHVVKPEIAEKGASLWIAKDVRRIPDDSVNQRAKNYHWGDLTAGLFEAKDNGFETVVLLDHDGIVTEGPGFNVFAVKGDTVVTSDHGVLHGITRRTVLEMAEASGLQTRTRPMPLDELLEADEVFLSSTGGGVIPITRVDARVFSNGAPGPISLALKQTFHDWRLSPKYRDEIAYRQPRLHRVLANSNEKSLRTVHHDSRIRLSVRQEECTVVLKRIIRSFLAVAGLFGALMSQPAHAVIYDVSLGGTMTGIRFGSFGALPSQVGQHLQSGNVLSAEFTFDVTGNTINAVSGSVTFDGASGNVTAFGSNSGGTGFRGFVVRFDELADGSSNVGDVSIDDMDFRITASSGQAVEDMFESALSNASAIFRSSVVATFRNSSGGTSFHRGQLDNDGTLSTQNVALAATVPVPAGFLLMMTGLIGLGVILRNGNAPLRNSVTA